MAKLSAGTLSLVLTSVVGPIVATPLYAQGIGEVASREKQKRQSQPRPGRIYTQDDLTGTKGTITGTDAPATAPGSDATARPGTTGNEAPAAGSPASAQTATPAGRSADPSAGLDEAEAALAIEQDRQERILLEADWRTRFASARQRLAVAEAEAWRDEYETSIYNGVPIRIRKRVHVETNDLERARGELADSRRNSAARACPPAGPARSDVAPDARAAGVQVSS